MSDPTKFVVTIDGIDEEFRRRLERRWTERKVDVVAPAAAYKGPSGIVITASGDRHTVSTTNQEEKGKR